MIRHRISRVEHALRQRKTGEIAIFWLGWPGQEDREGLARFEAENAGSEIIALLWQPPQDPEAATSIPSSSLTTPTGASS